jgi:chorismate-pyruvate lyase
MSDRRNGWEMMHALSERILRSNSATEELERWCGERAIGDGCLVALCDRHATAEMCDDESLEALYPWDVRGKTTFRAVRLATAGIVVVEAFNWYFADHLSPEMRTTLETTDVPFGRVVKPMKPKRRTFLVRRCTPEQMNRGNSPTDPAATAFEHRAVLYGEADVPLAIVHERFLKVLVCGVSEFMVARPQRSMVPGPAALAVNAAGMAHQGGGL